MIVINHFDRFPFKFASVLGLYLRLLANSKRAAIRVNQRYGGSVPVLNKPYICQFHMTSSTTAHDQPVHVETLLPVSLPQESVESVVE